jgi:hypothetical protein
MPKGVPNSELPCLDIVIGHGVVVYDHGRQQWALPGRQMTSSKAHAREVCRLIHLKLSKTLGFVDA